MRKFTPEFLRKYYRELKYIKNSLKYRNKQKIFCIGRNKTGTTSMALLFKELGFALAPQRPAEWLTSDWASKDFNNIIRFVRNQGVAFQDVPFSLPGTFKVLDEAFPNSKFILTVRDSPEIWYNSVVKFAGKLYANGKLPTKQDLHNATYLYKGYIWELNRCLYNSPEDDIYRKEDVIRSYNMHNEGVIEYFKDRPNDLLVVNLSEKDALNRICKFLDKEPIKIDIPWVNKT